MRTRSGFSLVELSMVLVILGLLVGGILSGRSLIRASELRSIAAEHDKYFTAVESFKQKYFYLPGDMPNASKFWGLLSSDTNYCNMNQGAPPLTCDGNGDGRIDEGLRAWQHLANAGMIEGQYGGSIFGPLPIYPPGKIALTAWVFQYYGIVNYAAGTEGTQFNGDYGNSLSILDYNGAGPFLTPSGTWNIDVKVDDGKPGRGKLVIAGDDTNGSGIDTCAATADSSNLDANYDVSSNTKGCSIIYRQQF